MTLPTVDTSQETRRQRRRLRLAPWFAGLPYAVLPVFWIGLLATVDSVLSLGWAAAMWCSCLVLLPLAVTGAVWAGRARARGTMWAGIVAAVICLPGFVMAVMVIPFLLDGVLSPIFGP